MVNFQESVEQALTLAVSMGLVLLSGSKKDTERTSFTVNATAFRSLLVEDPGCDRAGEPGPASTANDSKNK